MESYKIELSNNKKFKNSRDFYFNIRHHNKHPHKTAKDLLVVGNGLDLHCRLDSGFSSF